MLKTTRLFVAVSLITWSGAPRALADDHLVKPGVISARLSERAAGRAEDLAAVQRVLATSRATRTMRTLGANPEEVRDRIATLSTAELQDLAARSRMLRVDPVAGLDEDVNTLLVVFLVVGIVILVIGAVD